MLLFNAIDRRMADRFYGPIWSGPDDMYRDRNNVIYIDIPYESFLGLLRLPDRLGSIFVGDLFRMARRIGYYGYIPQLFYAEILYRFAEVAFILPLSIFVIGMGWRYRTKKEKIVVLVPMLFLMPAVFNGLLFFFRGMLHSLSVWSVISFGFTISAVFYGAVVVLLLLISIINLMCLRSPPEKT
jgi:hypothetical protein